MSSCQKVAHVFNSKGEVQESSSEPKAQELAVWSRGVRQVRFKARSAHTKIKDWQA